jgi:glutamine amidotransferase
MCRHVAWLGEPRSLASLVLEPPSSLLVQSYAPRRQRHGTVNADGWGTGWWAPGRAEPARWRSATPLWGSASFASVAPAVSSSCAQLAALVFATGLDALGQVVRDVGGRDPAARLNLLAADGTRLLATTWGDTLSVLETPQGTVLASEPFDDDPRWTDVPDRHLVTVTAHGTTLESLS